MDDSNEILKNIPLMLKATDTAINLIKSIKGSSDSKLKTNELLDIIISLKQQQIMVYSQYQDLLEESYTNKKQITELKTWKQEQETYKLTEICTGVFVYSFKKTEDNSTPTHYLCQQCYK